jgi:hypothetical membrane protein
LAGLVFWSSLLGFAAARADYTHGTKAVSELGAIGVPAGLAFNLLAFVLPGALVAIFGWALAYATNRRVGPWLLILSGAFLVVAGAAPLDMADLGSVTSRWHLIGAMGSGLLWIPALFFCGPVLVHEFGLRAWGRITPFCSIFLLANVAWQAAYQSGAAILPGWGQRIGFLGYFLWFAVTGYLLWRQNRRVMAQA